MNNTKKSLPFNSTHYIMLYPENGDRVVTIDCVTSLNSPYVFSLVFFLFLITGQLLVHFVPWCISHSQTVVNCIS